MKVVRALKIAYLCIAFLVILLGVIDDFRPHDYSERSEAMAAGLPLFIGIFLLSFPASLLFIYFVQFNWVGPVLGFLHATGIAIVSAAIGYAQWFILLPLGVRFVTKLFTRRGAS